MTFMTRLPNTHAAVLKKVTAPQYDTTAPQYRHLDWLERSTLLELGKLRSIAEAIQQSCDEYADALASRTPGANGEAEAFADDAAEPLETLIKTLVAKGHVL